MTELIRALAHGRRPRPRALVVPLLVLAALLAAIFSVGASARSDGAAAERTVTLVARDMAFFLPGQTTANPRLVVARGERVRFVLVNEDPGMAHDLALPSLGEASRRLEKSGSSTELVVRAPATAGEHDYLCTLHAKMMRGVLEVR